MDNAIIDALQITIVGMGLVFAAILLLWGMMAILVRLTADSSPSAPDSSHQIKEDQKKDQMELIRKRRAALAAIAIAYAQLQTGPELHEFPLPPTPLVSAWQAVLRTRMIYKRGK